MLRRFLFNYFALVYRVSYWFNRHFSPLGHFLLGIMLVAAAFGANTRAATIYQFAALLSSLFGLALLWGLLGRRTKPSLSLERLLPLHGTVGESLRYQIAIVNRGERTERGLSLLDQLHVRFPDWDEFSNASASAQDCSNPFDRYVGFRRWHGLMGMNRGAHLDEISLPDLPPNRRVNVEMKLTPLRRGRLQFADVCINSPEPFGLFRTRHVIPLPQGCWVLPRCYPVSPLPGVDGRSYQRGGVALANTVGESEEFLSLREFRQGDVPRYIHWRSSARLGRLVVKEFQDEYFVRRALVLDTFCDPGRTMDFEAAISVSASLAMTEPQRDSLLDLLFVEQQAHCITAGRGLSGTIGVLEVLAGVRPVVQGHFDRLSHHVLYRANTLSGVVCVLLDWDPPRQALVTSLRCLGLPVAVLLVREREPSPKPDPDLFLRHIRPAHLAADLLWN